MRTYIMIFVLVLLCAGNVMGMGKSDGDKEKVKEPLMKQEAAPAKAEEVKAKPAKPVKPAPVEAKPAEPVAPGPVKVKTAKAEPVEDKVIVTVNGVKIMQSQVDKQIRTALEQVQASGRAIPPNAMDSMKARMQAGIVQQIIEKQLIDEKLKAENIKITDKQIDDKIAALAEQNGMSVEQLTAQMSMGGMTMADFRKRMRSGLGLEKVIELSGKLAPASEEEAKKFYDDKIQAGQIRASHILLVTSGKDETAKTVAKARIEELLKQAKAGVNFAQLAKANSDCPSKAKGGDLGFFEKGRMVPEFAEAAFTLKDGEISGVVETQFGYHIIKRMGFEDVKANLVPQLENEKKRNSISEYLKKLGADAEIVWPEQEKSEAKKTAEPAEK
jgi:peptidyl-prolyl cis-trans isomerase C